MRNQVYLGEHMGSPQQIPHDCYTKSYLLYSEVFRVSHKGGKPCYVPTPDKNDANHPYGFHTFTGISI